jgi:hypothetical protein
VEEGDKQKETATKFTFLDVRKKGLIAAPLTPLRAVFHPLGYLQ